MRDRAPRGWLFTLGLAGLALLGAFAARSATSATTTVAVDAEIEADSCFRYGRLECCIKDD